MVGGFALSSVGGGSGIAALLQCRRGHPLLRCRATVAVSLPFRCLRASYGALDAGCGCCDTGLVARRRSYAVRWRRGRVSKSWQSWHVFPSFPSGSSILSLPHSQVRSRISSARSNSRFRLACCPVRAAKRAAQMSRPSWVVLPCRRLSQPDESCAIRPIIAPRTDVRK